MTSSGPAIDNEGAKRSKSIIEIVSAVSAYMTAGLSEALLMPLRRLIERRLAKMEEIFIEEIRRGQRHPNDVIDEDRAASFVLRVARAATEGASARKLRIMARYFAQTASNPDFIEERLLDFVAVTEQMTDIDMRCLAVLKKAAAEGLIEAENTDIGPSRLIPWNLPVYGLFETPGAFRTSCVSMIRFGFIDMASAWDSIALLMTPRCTDYLDNVDAELLNAAE